MQKLFIILASISGFLAVAIGAFGAHGLKNILEKYSRVETFNTGVQYHFYHTFALLAVAILMNHFDSKMLNYAGWSFLSGIIIFSCSLYVLSVTNFTKLGAITPIGGLFFLAGWVFLLLTILKS